MVKVLPILLLSFSAIAQETFNKTFDFLGGLDFPISVLETDSGYVVHGFGQNRVITAGWNGLVFVEMDRYGDALISNYYGVLKVNYVAGWEGSFIKTNYPGYAVGVTEFDSVRGNYKAILIKYDEEGDTLFLKRFGGIADDHAYQVIQSPDNGFVLIGQTTSFGKGFYFVKTDSLGNLQWQKTYANSSNSRGLSVVVAHNGGYVMSGWKYSQAYDLDTYVVNTDSAGNERWKKRYGSRNDDGGGLIALSSDTTYIVYGNIDTFNLTTTNGQKLWSSYIMKIDTVGEVKWRNITDFNWYHQIAMIREVAPGKGYIAVGQIYDSIFGANNAYGWLLRLDNDGDTLWERKYAYPNIHKPNGLAFSSLYDVQRTGDGGFICLGFSDGINQDFWLLKLDGNGCMGNYCGLTDTSCFYKPYPNCDDAVGIGTIPTPLKDIRLRIYPNPANNLITFHATSKFASIRQICLFDSQGRLTITNNTGDSKLLTGHLPVGLYYYEVLIEDALLPSSSLYPVRGKIMIESVGR